MPSYRVPVFVWEDFQGFFTARAMGAGDGYAGFAETASRAVARAKEYLNWYYKDDPFASEPDFLDPRLVRVAVGIRPEYRKGERIYPCSDLVNLRVVCVTGREESGLLIASIPRLDIAFYYHDPAAVKGLVTHYVKQRFRGETPLALSRFLPAKSVRLEGIAIRIDHKPKQTAHVARFESLEGVAEPLWDRAIRGQFSRALEREDTVEELARRIAKEKANVILVGERGIGKTAIMIDAARRIGKRLGVPGGKRRFWLSSGARIIAGMKYLGQWEERCEALVEELAEFGGYLCVESLFDLTLAVGRQAQNGIAAFFLPYLERGELHMLAEATPEELDACRRLLPGLADVFQTLRIPEFDRPTAVRALNSVANSRCQALRVESEEGLAEAIYRLFARFMPYVAFPGKAVSFLMRLFEKAARDKHEAVGQEFVVTEFIRETGLPELFVRDDITLDHADVFEAFRKQIIGQDNACRAAASLVTTFKAGLNDPNRPIGALLFCGPTGVGKTALAKAICDYFFGHGDKVDPLVRLDMSEYAGPGAASRLLSKPDGKPSDFIQRVRRQPFAVVLFDEIEKAAPEIFDMLMGVLDEGRLTDELGRTTTFKSAIIIMTSNLGADRQSSLGFGSKTGPSYEDEAMSFFRPEFFNRLDAVVTFNPLDQEAIRVIVIKELSEINEREGLKKSGVTLRCTDALVEQIAEQGFDERYGARPLQRTIERLVITPLAHLLVDDPGMKSQELTADVAGRGSVTIGIP